MTRADHVRAKYPTRRQYLPRRWADTANWKCSFAGRCTLRQATSWRRSSSRQVLRTSHCVNAISIWTRRLDVPVWPLPLRRTSNHASVPSSPAFAERPTLVTPIQFPRYPRQIVNKMVQPSYRRTNNHRNCYCTCTRCFILPHRVSA